MGELSVPGAAARTPAEPGSARCLRSMPAEGSPGRPSRTKDAVTTTPRSVYNLLPAATTGYEVRRVRELEGSAHPRARTVQERVSTAPACRARQHGRHAWMIQQVLPSPDRLLTWPPPVGHARRDRPQVQSYSKRPVCRVVAALAGGRSHPAGRRWTWSAKTWRRMRGSQQRSGAGSAAAR